MNEHTSSGQDHDMLYGPVVRTFWKYCLPWMLSMVATGSAAIIDGIFVGRYVGAMPLAAINLVMPLLTLISCLGVLMSTGGSVRAGKYLGEGDTQASSAMFYKTLIVLTCAVLLLVALGLIFQDWTVAFLGADEELAPLVLEYMVVLLYFAPAFPLTYCLSYFVRLDQRPVLASVGLGVSAVFNIALDYLLVARLDMGLTGAGMATGIAYTVSCLVLASHFFSSRSSFAWPKSLGRWSEVLKAAWNGFSEFVNEISAGVVIFLFNIILMKNLGGVGVAAYTVVGYTGMIGVILFYAVGDSLAPIISVNHGARNYKRASAFLTTAMVSVVLLEAAFFLLVTVRPQLLVELFLPDNIEVEALTLRFLGIYRWAFLFSGLNMVLASYFTGRQWAFLSMLVAVSRSLLMPVVLVLSLDRMFAGGDAIFLTSPIAEGLTLLLALLLFRIGKRQGPEARNIAPAA